ncbi:MAG: hypothetical protein WAV07_06795 [Candidatus Contendobacter sp.]
MTTMTMTIPVSESALPVPNVRRITTSQPWQWLGAGWNDLWRVPAASLAYGLLTFYLGLALALPLIGHATWHAYRSLVEDSDLEPQPI